MWTWGVDERDDLCISCRWHRRMVNGHQHGHGHGRDWCVLHQNKHKT